MRLSHDPRGMVLTIVLSTTLAATAYGQQVDVQRLSERVLVLNLPMLGQRQVVAVSARRGLALIDTGPSPLVATMLKEDVERRFGRQDWACAINTHGHIDGHTNGNGVFADIPVIGHENAAAEIAARLDAVASGRPAFCRERVRELQERVDAGAEDAAALQDQIAVWRSIEEQTVRRDIMAPNLTFSERLTIDMGDLTLRLLYFGIGHSASDVVVYIPEEKLLVSGGVCGPYLPVVAESARMADLRRSISVLDDVLDGGVERVVTSHWGILEGGQNVRRQRDYRRDLLAGVTSACERGLGLEETQAELALDRCFPYMADVKPAQGSQNEAHAANVAVVFKLVDRQPVAGYKEYFGETPPVSGAKLFAPGFASTQHHDDMSPVFSPDGREVILRILGKREGKMIGLLYTTRMTDAGEWTTPRPLPFLTRHMNGHASFTPDGSRIYFTTRRPLPGEEESEVRSRIWSAPRTSDGWGNAALVETPINQYDVNGGLFIAADGTMYASFVAPGKEKHDIYELKAVDGGYPEYHPLPGAVNSPDTEVAPFVNQAEGYLLYTFASADGMSVKISFLEGDDRWSEPEVIDDLMESAAKFASVSPDGRHLFFVSHKQTDQSNPQATWPIDDFDAPALDSNADIYWMDARFVNDRVSADRAKDAVADQ